MAKRENQAAEWLASVRLSDSLVSIINVLDSII